MKNNFPIPHEVSDLVPKDEIWFVQREEIKIVKMQTVIKDGKMACETTVEVTPAKIVGKITNIGK